MGTINKNGKFIKLKIIKLYQLDIEQNVEPYFYTPDIAESERLLLCVRLFKRMG